MSDRGQEDSGGQESSEPTTTVASAGRSVAEWTTLAISCAVLATVLGVLLHAHATRGREVPVVEAIAESGQARREGESYVVPVRVRNTGGAAARDVRVRVRVESSPGVQDTQSGPEQSEFVLDVLAAGSEATGAAVFRSAPTAGRVRAEVVSYTDP